MNALIQYLHPAIDVRPQFDVHLVPQPQYNYPTSAVYAYGKDSGLRLVDTDGQDDDIRLQGRRFRLYVDVVCVETFENRNDALNWCREHRANF